MRVHRHFLSKKNTKEINSYVEKTFPLIFQEYFKGVKTIEIAKIDYNDKEYTIYILRGRPILAKIDNEVLPLMTTIMELYEKYGFSNLIKYFKYAVVDEGALKPILRGADIMAPGIVENSEFQEKDMIIVFVRVKENNIPIAIGKALKDSKYMTITKKGKIIKNIHRVKDKLWEISTKL